MLDNFTPGRIVQQSSLHRSLSECSSCPLTRRTEIQTLFLPQCPWQCTTGAVGVRRAGSPADASPTRAGKPLGDCLTLAMPLWSKMGHRGRSMGYRHPTDSLGEVPVIPDSIMGAMFLNVVGERSAYIGVLSDPLRIAYLKN